MRVAPVVAGLDQRDRCLHAVCIHRKVFVDGLEFEFESQLTFGIAVIVYVNLVDCIRIEIEVVRTAEWIQYVDTRLNKQGQKSPATGVFETRVFKHAFTKAVEWGLMARHPFKGEVRLKGAKPRTRYIEDWEVIEALSLVPKRKSGSVLMLQAYIRVKMLIGIRRGDMLRLRMSDITDAGVTVRPHKTVNSTGLARTFEWTPALRTAIDMALAARPLDIAPWLFCTKRGEGYFDEETGQASGWDSMWQRFMARLLEETKITERFTEHDLRGKVGSDAESLERARQLLGHADSKITERVYRRKPELIRPLR